MHARLPHGRIVRWQYAISPRGPCCDRRTTTAPGTISKYTFTLFGRRFLGCRSEPVAQFHPLHPEVEVLVPVAQYLLVLAQLLRREFVNRVERLRAQQFRRRVADIDGPSTGRGFRLADFVAGQIRPDAAGGGRVALAPG